MEPLGSSIFLCRPGRGANICFCLPPPGGWAPCCCGNHALQNLSATEALHASSDCGTLIERFPTGVMAPCVRCPSSWLVPRSCRVLRRSPAVCSILWCWTSLSVKSPRLLLFLNDALSFCTVIFARRKVTREGFGSDNGVLKLPMSCEWIVRPSWVKSYSHSKFFLPRRASLQISS